MHFLIIKHGALGDVVRTSYFAASLKEKHGPALRLSWLTAPASERLLGLNPNVDDVWVSFETCQPFAFDRVFSLDDEIEIVTAASRLNAARITGAYLADNGTPAYTPDSAEWFDMGLISQFGKARADSLKRTNHRSHAEIFSRIFEVEKVQPSFYGEPVHEEWADAWCRKDSFNIGINAFAGGRWPSKQLIESELIGLIRGLLKRGCLANRKLQITLTGAGNDFLQNERIVKQIDDARIRAADTRDSVMRLAALIGKLDYFISSDSLAMHLAIAQRVPFLAFFSPTSAVEIDGFGFGAKVASLAPDYCSYLPDTDNRTITAARLLAAFEHHAAQVPPLHGQGGS